MAGNPTTISSLERFSGLPSSVVYEDDGRGFFIHEVSKSDTLAGLAIKYGVEVMDIKRANRLVEDRQMFAQKTLRIPLPGPHPPAPSITSPVPSRTASRSYNSAPPKLHPSRRSTGCREKNLEEEHKEKRVLTPAIGLLRGYYGLKSPSSKDDEGTEMSVYKTVHKSEAGADALSDDELFSASTPPSNRWALSDHDRSPQERPGGDGGHGRAEIQQWSEGATAATSHGEGRDRQEESFLRRIGGSMGSEHGFGRRESGAAGASAWESNHGVGRRGSGIAGPSGREGYGDMNAASSGSPSHRRSGGARKGRSSQAEEVAAVVEELAKAHRDNHMPVGMAGEVGRGAGGEDLQGDRLTRRRARGESWSDTLGQSDPAGVSTSGSEWGSGGGGSKGFRSSVPSQSPFPKPKPGLPVEEIPRLTPPPRSSSSLPLNGRHMSDNGGSSSAGLRRETEERARGMASGSMGGKVGGAWMSGTGLKAEGEAGSGSSAREGGMLDFTQLIRKSSSSPILKGETPFGSGRAERKSSFDSPPSAFASVAGGNVVRRGLERLGLSSQRGATPTRRYGGKPAAD